MDNYGASSMSDMYNKDLWKSSSNSSYCVHSRAQQIQKESLAIEFLELCTQYSTDALN